MSIKIREPTGNVVYLKQAYAGISLMHSKLAQHQRRVIIWINFVPLESLMLPTKFQRHQPFSSGAKDF